MGTSQSTKSLSVMPGSLTRNAIQRYVGNKWFLLATAGLALVAVAAFCWNWLVAAGIASIFLSVLPCLVMCALGLCMHKFFGNSGSALTRGSVATDQPDSLTHAVTDNSTPYVASCCGGGSLVTPANAPAEVSPEGEDRCLNPHCCLLRRF
jgi:hypothetical protein